MCNGMVIGLWALAGISMEHQILADGGTPQPLDRFAPSQVLCNRLCPYMCHSMVTDPSSSCGNPRRARRFLWTQWLGDSHHPKFYFSVLFCRCATATAWHCTSTTARPICNISSSMEMYWPAYMQQYGHWPICRVPKLYICHILYAISTIQTKNAFNP